MCNRSRHSKSIYFRVNLLAEKKPWCYAMCYDSYNECWLLPHSRTKYKLKSLRFNCNKKRAATNPKVFQPITLSIT